MFSLDFCITEHNHQMRMKENYLDPENRKLETQRSPLFCQQMALELTV